MGLRDLYANIQKVDFVKLAGEALLANGVEALDLNRQQMMRGQGINGNQFKPYATDPYFQGNTARAEGYSRFKQRITPQTPTGIPNFFINGLTHNNLTLTVTDKQYTITSTVPWAGRVQSWQNNNVFGLTPQSVQALYDSKIRDYLLTRFKQIMGI